MTHGLILHVQGPTLDSLAGSIKVCANSLRSQDIDVSDLAEGIGVVPAAVSHLAERQWQGWAYVRI